jgi:RNA polymerase sigma-70 factor, ECF subfamily
MVVASRTLALERDLGGSESRVSVVNPPASREAIFRELFRAHYAFIWRQLRRLGVPEGAVDDAAQEAFVVAARRLDDIRAGSERAFLLGVARRIAADARRSGLPRNTMTSSEDLLGERADAAPDPEQALQGSRARALLDTVLDAMDDDTRAVFVLFEFEELSKGEIADVLGIPEGTAASRLRRGREEFLAIARRLRAKLGLLGGTR